MKNEKEILDTLIDITNNTVYELNEHNKMLNEIRIGLIDSGLYDSFILQNELIKIHLNECLDYLNKRLVEIDPNRPCEHYFAIAWIKKGKFKKHFYYKNCEFCGCEPLKTLRDLNRE